MTRASALAARLTRLMRHMTRIALLAVSLSMAAGAPVRADTPLSPPQLTRTQIGQTRVTADPGRGITLIQTPGLPNWTVPGWHRFWALSPDVAHFLAIQPGGNLISGNSPQTPAFTVHNRAGCPPEVITLDQLPGRGADLARTASHYLLFDSLRWDAVALAWRVTLGNGADVLIYPQDCEMPAQIN